MSARSDRRPHLLDVETAEKWTGSRALVPLARERCANCAAELVTDSTAQPALFVHGGYGETQRGTALWCPECGWQGGGRREAENSRERTHKAPR